jgi:hypothetical protein
MLVYAEMSDTRRVASAGTEGQTPMNERRKIIRAIGTALDNAPDNDWTDEQLQGFIAEATIEVMSELEIEDEG